MQKKIIFMVVMLSLVGGFFGGVTGEYLLNLNDSSERSLLVVPGGTKISSEESPLIAAQNAVAPAVISIIQYANASQFGEAYLSGNLNATVRKTGGGTGFLVDPSGLAITNKHVVSNESAYYAAVLNDGTRYELTVEARDPFNDVAIVRLKATEGTYEADQLGNLPYVHLGDSSLLRVGEPVLAIGNALAEYANTTTAGIISATGRQVVASDHLGAFSSLSGLLQTDAAINFGNSGGPLANLRGEVIALNTALDDEARGIGFAIPINDVKPALESYRHYGEIRRPFLGVRYTLLTASMARELNLDVTKGAFLFDDPATGESAVSLDSPADRAGLKAGDVIVKVNGEEVALDRPLQDLVGHKQVGETIMLLVWREGAFFEVNVELTNR